jgi:hypothetical protein
MNLVNQTRMQAGYTTAVDKSCRDHLVVVVKGTFGIPERAERSPELLDEQAPLVATDEFSGEPGFSAPVYEMDFALYKPRCDVLLNGSAYAPKGQSIKRTTVSLQVGPWTKSFDVVGNRKYQVGALYLAVSEIEPFQVMPISYDHAFGGIDRTSEDPAKQHWYPSNHAGVGYYETTATKAVNEKPLPNTEETGHPIRKPNGKYKPMAFGPVGRAWQPRVKWAGTYDQKWLDDTAPFLPQDFDERYYQAAPEDQQTGYPRGGEPVVLTNLTPGGHATFPLPELELAITFVFRNGRSAQGAPVIDTIVIEPDLKRLMLVWRTNLPLRRNLFELLETRVEQRR